MIAVYASLLCLVAMSVIAGPAMAGTISNLNIQVGYTNVTTPSGVLVASGYESGFYFNLQLTPYETSDLVKLTGEIACDPEFDSCGPQSFQFSFDADGFPSPVNLSINANGTLESIFNNITVVGGPTAEGFIGVSVGTPGTINTSCPGTGYDLEACFDLTEGPFLLDGGSKLVNHTGNFTVNGELYISYMSSGTRLTIPDDSIDIQFPRATAGVPEPASVFLLASGLAALAVLRRKIRTIR